MEGFFCGFSLEDPNWLLLKGVQASNLLQKV